MTSGNLQGDDSYPSCLAGIKGEQLISRQFIRCSKGTPIIKKFNPFLFVKGGTTKEEKTKVMTLNKYMAMGPSGARFQE
jgi:hypothetical protein